MNNLKIKEILAKYPFIINFFSENRLDIKGFEDLSFVEFLNNLSYEEIEEKALDKDRLIKDFEIYIDTMCEFLMIEKEFRVDTLTIVAGFDKSGNKETYGEITIRPSEVISIVGKTGSGKSRLLQDIEWGANNDTPTKRVVLVNGKVNDKSRRYTSNQKMVAQLSQNMNFIMDLSVLEFLEIHAKSRLVDNVDNVVKEIFNAANILSGEKFLLDTPITSLSGGQSRALMIADTAILSSSPIVLIDEIENAGIDRKQALNLLVSNDKIVLIATHDPLQALMADKRIVLENGGISKVISTSDKEKRLLEKLKDVDDFVNSIRASLRKGESLDI